MGRLPRHGADAVYTTRWLTMGVQRADADWLPKFRPYTVTPEVMAAVSKADGNTVFLHDLPACGGTRCSTRSWTVLRASPCGRRITR
jgi:ornithine carbamoyltransferase